MRDLLTDPLWRESDLGRPIPDSEHAVSVALPHWKHVVGYEEKEPAVIEAMWCGYPRFVIHPYVIELHKHCAERFAKKGQACIAFPSEASALRCLDYVLRAEGAEGRLDALDVCGIHVVTFAEELIETACEYRRYSGEVVSSRRARAALDRRPADSEGETAGQTVRERIAGLTGQAAEDVYLFASGMAAHFHIHRLLEAVCPQHKTVQMGFPYVDVLKVQQKFGAGVHLFPLLESPELDALEDLLAEEKVAGVFTEFPNNTLLRCVDVERLAAILRQRETPLIVDDTVGGFYNIDAFRYADATFTSLTKYLGGQGDIMAGSVVLNRQSPFYERFKEHLNRDYENGLYADDAVALDSNSRNYEERMARINAGAATVFDYLQSQKRIDEVYYPLNQTPDHYGQLLREGRGYGGLISLLLKHPEKASPKFYNALRVSKGPTLGTNYTLACPYTLLAHYEELDWAESCGISRYLIRLAVGLEEPEEIITRLEEAFAAI